MHIQKLLAIICVGAVSSSVVVQGADSDVQAKAREQLRQAMSQLPATNSTAPMAPVTPPAPAVPAYVPPAPVYQPAPVAPITPVAPTPVVTATPRNTDAQARALEALRAEKARLDAADQAGTSSVAASAPAVPAMAQPVYATPPTAPVSPIVSTPASVDATMPMVKADAALDTNTFPVIAAPTPAYTPENPEAQAKALEALRTEKARLDAADQTMAIATGHANPQGQPMLRPIMGNDNVYISSQTGLPVQVAPPVLAPGSKDQRLNDLLVQYKADQISPTEYHNRRAKILSEP